MDAPLDPILSASLTLPGNADHRSSMTTLKMGFCVANITKDLEWLHVGVLVQCTVHTHTTPLTCHRALSVTSYLSERSHLITVV